MRKFSFLALLALAFLQFGFFGPRTSTGLTASQDVLANSSDSHSVGVSSNYWRNSFTAYQYMSYHHNQPATVASFGIIYVSLDGNIYYVDGSGTRYSLDKTAA